MNMQRSIAALVPLSLFGLAFVLLSPPAWVGALRNSLAKQPALVVIDADVPIDPSDLNALIWLPRQAFNGKILNKVERVLWVRAPGAPEADLEGRPPLGCREAHGVQLCSVEAKSAPRWRLSEHLLGVEAKGSRRCVSAGGNTRCAYGDQNWEYLRREEHRFDGRSEPCIWSHPLKDQELLVTVPKLAPGRYLLRAGVTDDGQRGGLPAVTLRLEGFEAGGPVTMTTGTRRGMEQLELPPLSKPTTLTLGISAPSTGARFLCWDMLKSP